VRTCLDAGDEGADGAGGDGADGDENERERPAEIRDPVHQPWGLVGWRQLKDRR
jgi:hypothetical protein